MLPRARILPAVVCAAIVASCRPAPDTEVPAPAMDPDTMPSAYATATAPLRAAGATRAYLVTPAGDLTNGVWRVVLRAAVDGAPAAPPRRITFEARWLPVAHWARVAGDVRFDFEAVARPSSQPADTNLFVSLRVRASNRASMPRRASFAADFDTLEWRPPYVAPDVRRSPRPEWAGAPGARHVAGEVRSSRPPGPPRFEWTLGPGQSAAAELLLAAYPTGRDAPSRRSPDRHAARADAVRREWHETLARGARFELGDADAERALAAATVVLLSERTRRGREWLPIGGPFHYRDIWLRDGARACVALAVLGYTAESRQLAASFARFLWPNGAILSQRAQLDGPGQALWAFAQVQMRPAPDSSVARLAALAEGAVGWYQSQRDAGSSIDSRFARLLPVVDPRDAELVFGQLTGNDAWAVAGLRAAAELLAAAGRNDEARRASALAVLWRREFESAVERTGHPDLPASWQGTGLDWGNLACGWPTGVLRPGHPRLHALAERYWRAVGGPGLGWYGTPALAHGYVGADLGTWAMLAGRTDDALRVLSAHLDARDAAGGSAETFVRASADFGRNLPPHPTAAAAVVSLIRNALVFDDEPDTLRLTMAARTGWWRSGRVTGAPTRWGRLDLRFVREGDAAAWEWTAVPVWTRLGLPHGVRLAGGVPAPLVAAPDGRSLLAPPGTPRVRVGIAESGR